MTETLALGRAKRSTAGNRMRELLEKAHQEDEDEIFREVEDDEDFAAPQETRDVFLEDFADTDEEVEMDEEEQERLMWREERRKAKGKSKAIYNPHIPTIKKPSGPAVPGTSSSPSALASSSQYTLLDPTLDPESMAPSTLVLALRKQRREAKRAGRSEIRRSNLRASTLRTEEEILAKERHVKENPNRKGRKAQHEGGEVRGVRAMTQDELIAAAFEEEERNKESLRDWLRKEEERRELRRVGRKRVKGPRWTWVSRTVGKAVEVVEEVQMQPGSGEAGHTPVASDAQPISLVQGTSAPPLSLPTSSTTQPSTITAHPPTLPPATPALPSTSPAPVPPSADLPYTRNYLILSQIPGGLPAEFSLILGGHNDWSSAVHVPARNRPLTRRPPLCPFTGLPAKYRHPRTGVQYANVEGYKLIEGLLGEEYVWNEQAGWMGREDEVCGEVEGWGEAVSGGWMRGKRMRQGAEGEGEGDAGEAMGQGEVEVVLPSPATKRGRKRKSEVQSVVE